MKNKLLIGVITTVLVLCSCGKNNDVSVSTTVTETTTVQETTQTPPTTTTKAPETTTETTEAHTQPIETTIQTIEASTETTTEESTIETTVSSINEKEVYEYLMDLLNSDKHPANGSIPDISDQQAVNEYVLACEAYEIEATKKTAEHFGISEEEVDNIFFKYALE